MLLRLRARDRVTASIGGALYHPDLPSLEDYVDRACRAMDVAKEEGRNTYSSMRRPSTSFSGVVAIGTDLHHALEDEDLEVYFQPQVDLRTNQVVGLEALARWSHPRRGAVEPTEFIPVAERTNLIIPLGNWILQAACRQARICWTTVCSLKPWRSICRRCSSKIKALSRRFAAHLAITACHLSGSSSRSPKVSSWNRWGLPCDLGVVAIGRYSFRDR